MLCRPLHVERKQTRQDRVLGDLGGDRFVPAVGGPDSAVEVGVGVLKPGRALVVEVGQGSLFQLGPGCAFGVEPVAAQGVEPGGGPPIATTRGSSTGSIPGDHGKGKVSKQVVGV